MRLVAAVLVRRGGEVLLVRQQGPGDAQASWALPAGVVEAGELLTVALAREVREETGLVLMDPGRVLYTAQLSDGEDSSVAVVFETDACQGEIDCNDPDGFVSAAEFVTRDEAVARLNGLPWRHMREPIVAYLRGEVAVGKLWVYRKEGEEVVLKQVV